jgi:hypothetical protein
MTNERAVRYRRLALCERDPAIRELLQLLADESDQGRLCIAQWRSGFPKEEFPAYLEFP